MLYEVITIRENAPFFSWDGSIHKFLEWLDNIYVRTIRWALHHKKVIVPVAIFVFFGSMALFGIVGAEFIPQSDESTCTATVELQTGTRYEQTLKVADRIDSLVKADIPEVTLISTSTGTDDSYNFV